MCGIAGFVGTGDRDDLLAMIAASSIADRMDRASGSRPRAVWLVQTPAW